MISAGKRGNVIPQETAIRVISIRAFMQRFNQSERIAIRNSTDDIVIDIHEDLKMALYVNLDDDDTGQALDYLTSVGLIEASRKAEILADGTEVEKYEGAL